MGKYCGSDNLFFGADQLSPEMLTRTQAKKHS